MLATGALLAGLLGALPHTGLTPGLAPWQRAEPPLPALVPVPELASVSAQPPVHRLARAAERPARRIDDAVRARARAAVEHALARQEEGLRFEIEGAAI
jgi:hypothetical protein